MDGLILVQPHGTLIKNNIKSIIVKSKKFNISNKKMLLVENKVGLGIIELENPIKINIRQFKKLYKYHQISEEERKEWWSKYNFLFAYKIIKFNSFTKPILLNYKTGPQVIVKKYDYKHIFIGTSGFFVKVNDYLKKLNSIEINHTFYKFPTKTLLQNLQKYNLKYNLKYSIKVNQYITHYKQLLNVKQIWNDFYNAFEPISNLVKCFLFQFSEKFLANSHNFDKIKKFSKLLDSKHHYVFEFRNTDWYEYSKLLNKLNIIVCSNLNFINVHNNVIYFRLNGKTGLYEGLYTSNDLKYLYETIKTSNINEAFIYFNNTDTETNEINDAFKNAKQLTNKLNELNKN